MKRIRKLAFDVLWIKTCQIKWPVKILGLCLKTNVFKFRFLPGIHMFKTEALAGVVRFGTFAKCLDEHRLSTLPFRRDLPRLDLK